MSRPPGAPSTAVLIVDDDEESRNTLRRLVESFGVRVRTAADGQEALDVIRADPPDLVLCDLQMPNMSGFELVAKLRADPRRRRMPVIAVTGFVAPAAVMETWKTGFDGHVVKPLTREAVARLLEHVATRRQQGHS